MSAMTGGKSAHAATDQEHVHMVGPAAIKYHQLPSICITFLQRNSTSCEGISGSVRAGAVASLGSPRNGKTSGCDRAMLIMIDHDFIGH